MLSKAKLHLLLAVSMVMIFGYVFTIETFGNYILEYTIYNILSIASVITFALTSKGGVRALFPAWIFFWIFILAYYLKFYWVILDDSLLTNRAFFFYGLFDDIELMIRVFRLITFSFIAFVFSVYFIDRYYTYQLNIIDRLRYPNIRVPKLSIYVTYSLILLLLSLTLLFSANLKMGKGVELANNVTGIIVYLRVLVLPILMVFFIWQGYQRSNKNIILLGVITLLLYGVLDGILRESKSSVLLSVIILMFYLVLSGVKIKKKMKVVLSLFFMLSIFTYPVLKDYRERAGKEDISLATAAIDFYSSANSLDIIVTPASMVLSRVIGIGSLSVVISKDYDPLYFEGLSKIISVNIHVYFNEKIFGSVGSAPSILGFFYVLFGFFGSIFFIPIFVLMIFKIWFFIGAKGIKYQVVLQAGFLKLLLGELSDGDLGRGLVFRLPIFILVMILCGVLLRIGRKRVYK